MTRQEWLSHIDGPIIASDVDYDGSNIVAIGWTFRRHDRSKTYHMVFTTRNRRFAVYVPNSWTPIGQAYPTLNSAVPLLRSLLSPEHLATALRSTLRKELPSC